MGNKSTNPATPDNITQSNNGAPNKSSVVAVDSKGNIIGRGDANVGVGIPVNTQSSSTPTPAADQRTGNLPNQPPGGNTNAIPQPGEQTNPPAAQPQNAVQPAGAEAGTSGTEAGNADTGMDIDKLISESTKEIKTIDTAQDERKKKQERLMTALSALNYMETVVYKNEETNEEIGTKFRYTKDPHGKTIYEYINDPEISDHIGFKLDENDQQDGSFIEKQISIYWINPVF